jgi:hypothetical protein
MALHEVNFKVTYASTALTVRSENPSLRRFWYVLNRYVYIVTKPPNAYKRLGVPYVVS